MTDSQTARLTTSDTPDVLGTKPREIIAKLMCEFLGTFFLVLTVACGSLSKNPQTAGAAAMALMVLVYVTGPVSGGNLNPAVTLSLLLKGEMNVKCAVLYVISQIFGGFFASLLSMMIFDGQTVPLGPGKVFGYQFSMMQALLVEGVYTTMLCLTVLCVAATKINKSEAFGLAIGSVIIAGGYAAGGISGAAFNPAVAFGLDWTHAMKIKPQDVTESNPRHVKNSAYYAAVQLGAAILAALLHRVIYPTDYVECEKGRPKVLETPEGANPFTALKFWWLRKPILHRMMSELVGTYFLVVTVGLSIATKAVCAPLAIGASLMVMIYALRGASGGHFNPAVTMAIWCSHPRPQTPAMLGSVAGLYITAQLAGAQLAGVTYAGLFKWKRTFGLEPHGNDTMREVAAREIVFTFVLVFTVLMLTQVKDRSKVSKSFFGLVIGSTVMMGGAACGNRSGWSFNPAVSFGIDFASAAVSYKHAAKYFGAYVGFELIGAIMAYCAYRILAHEEFAREEKGVRDRLLEDFNSESDEEGVQLVEKPKGPPGPVPKQVAAGGGGPPGPVPEKFDKPADAAPVDKPEE